MLASPTYPPTDIHAQMDLCSVLTPLTALGSVETDFGATGGFSRTSEWERAFLSATFPNGTDLGRANYSDPDEAWVFANTFGPGWYTHTFEVFDGWAAALGRPAGQFGVEVSSVLRLTAHVGGSALSGLRAPNQGQLLLVCNVSTAEADRITVLNNDPSAAAENRILADVVVIIPPNGSRWFWYDLDATRWRVLSA